MRFEKISLEQFKKDWTKYVLKPVADDDHVYSKFIGMDGTDLDYSILANEKFVESIYEDINIPQRGTAGSAGYDFYMPLRFRLDGYEEKSITIPTGIRCIMENNQYLMICPRSGLGCKGLGLINTVGIIDSDYSNAENEGHILVSLNNSTCKDIIISAGQGFVQGIVQNYCIAENDKVKTTRKGGFGSTDKACSAEDKLYIYKEIIKKLGGNDLYDFI